MNQDKNASQKTCVFCGNPPDEKTKEHVVPRWLIELTGDPKRAWNLGIRYSEPDASKRRRVFAADQFQFPACSGCNSAYSSMEGEAKSHMVKLLAGEPLSASNWDTMLDWFDKVRIGLWLGMRMFSQELPLIPAKFHINQRISTKDRCILVYRISDKNKGLIMTGVGDPPFLTWPSCFALTVNNLIFINISTDFLLASRLGFPFPRQVSHSSTLSTASNFDAFFYPKAPLLRFSFPSAPIAIYQTVLMDNPLDEQGQPTDDDPAHARLKDHPFVRERLFPGTNRSLLHSSQGTSVTFHQPEDLVYERHLSKAEYRHGVEYLLCLFDYREHLLKGLLSSGLAQNSKQEIKLMVKLNKWAAEQLEADWKKYQRGRNK